MDLPKDEATRLFDYASELFAQEKFVEALDVLEQLYAYRKTSRRVNFARAECLYRIGEFGAAISICDELISEHEYDPARKLRAKLETRQRDGMQNGNMQENQDSPLPPALASLGALQMDMDFDLPPTRIGPPPGLSGRARASAPPTLEYAKIGGSALFLALMAALLTLVVTSENVGLGLAPARAFGFVFTQLLAYPIALSAAAAAFKKLPKESVLENAAYIGMISAMLGAVSAGTLLAYLVVPPVIAEFGGLLCLNAILMTTLRFGFVNLVVFVLITAITRITFAIVFLGAQLIQWVA